MEGKMRLKEILMVQSVQLNLTIMSFTFAFIAGLAIYFGFEQGVFQLLREHHMFSMVFQSFFYAIASSFAAGMLLGIRREARRPKPD